MKAKIAFTLGILSTLLLGTWVYAATNYVSVAQSLTYLRSAWDIGHIWYIITSIFDTNNNKIKQEYLDLTWLSSSWAIETETDPVWLSQKAWYVATARSILTTSPLSGGGNLWANRTISIAKSTASVDGYLSKEDFTAFSGKAPIASPTFTWVPKAPTPLATSNDTTLATTAFVQQVVDAKVAAAGGSTFYQLWSINSVWITVGWYDVESWKIILAYRSSQNFTTLEDADNYCTNLSVGGYSNWSRIWLWAKLIPAFLNSWAFAWQFWDRYADSYWYYFMLIRSNGNGSYNTWYSSTPNWPVICITDM